MRRLATTSVLGLTLILASCGPTTPIGGSGGTVAGGQGGPRAAPEPPRRPAVPSEWVEMICDRVEDCSVERNVELAKAFGGTETDLEAARQEARQALVSGTVRRWCQMRVEQLQRPDAERIRGCLGQQTACGPFYQCARFGEAEAGIAQRPGPRPTPPRDTPPR